MRTTENFAGQENVVSGKFRRPLVLRLIGRLKSWNQRRLAIRELQGMSDYLLRDLGIERFQIADAVKNSGEFTQLPAAKKDSAVAPLKKAAA